MFALVLPTCHRHVGFEWVRIRDSSPTSKRPTSEAGGAVRGRWIRLPAFRWKAVRRKPVFALVFPTCHRHVGFEWVRIHLRFPHQQKGHHLLVMSFCWWGKVDSNHRSYKQQIYSLSPLATREFPHMKLAFLCGAGRRTRTPDLLITNQLLYQLSYTGRRSAHIRLLYYTMFSANVKTI